MTSQNVTTPIHQAHGSITIEIADVDLIFHSVTLDDRTPTGAQVAAAAGFAPIQQATVLHILPSGSFEDIRPDELVSLDTANQRFIVTESDASYRFIIDGKRFDWPAHHISGAIIRQLGDIPANHVIYFDQQDRPDQVVEDSTVLDLANAGIESFHSRHSTNDHHEPHPPQFVLIEIDGDEKEIPPGKYLIKDLKAKLGVPAEYELDLVEHGKFNPLDDNETINIEHPIKMVSHVKCGASS